MSNWFKSLWEKQEENKQKWDNWGKEKNKQRSEKWNSKLDAKFETYLNSLLEGTGAEKEQARSSIMKFKHSYPYYTLDYIGGHYQAPQGKEDVNVMFIPEHGLLIGNQMDMIPISDIQEVSFKTKEQIEKDVTLTRLIAFGWYAFALKKKRKTVTNYLIINCKKNEVPYSVALAGEGVDSLYTNIFNRLAG